MFQSLREWVYKAYPRNDAPLLWGHRPQSVILNTAEIVEVRFLPLAPNIHCRSNEVAPGNERMRLHIGAQRSDNSPLP